MMIAWLLSLLAWLAFGWATAAVGERVDGQFAGWFIFGLLIWPIALPMALTEAAAGDRVLSGRFWTAWVFVWVAVLSVVVIGGWEAAGL